MRTRHTGLWFSLTFRLCYHSSGVLFTLLGTSGLTPPHPSVGESPPRPRVDRVYRSTTLLGPGPFIYDRRSGDLILWNLHTECVGERTRLLRTMGATLGPERGGWTKGRGSVRRTLVEGGF